MIISIIIYAYGIPFKTLYHSKLFILSILLSEQPEMLVLIYFLCYHNNAFLVILPQTSPFLTVWGIYLKKYSRQHHSVFFKVVCLVNTYNLSLHLHLYCKNIFFIQSAGAPGPGRHSAPRGGRFPSTKISEILAMSYPP